MPFPSVRQPLRSVAWLLRGGVGLGVSIACLWYLLRAGLLRAHLPQALALPESSGEWVMPIAIVTMLACARCVALLPHATRLSRVHDAALAALLLPLLGLVPGVDMHRAALEVVTGPLAVAGAVLLFHGWGVRLAALSGLDIALCFAMATFVAESVLAVSASGLGGETAWLALGAGLPVLSRLLLGNITLPETDDDKDPAPLRPLPATLLAALFLASAACGLFYQLLDQLPPESDATVIASSAVFCGVALCAAILLRVFPSLAPRHLFRLALPLLGLGFATLMLLGQRMPRVPMFIQLSGSALLDVFMYSSLLHSAGLHAGRNRARILALYWALLFGSQWAGSLLFMVLGLLLPPDIAHIQVLSLAAVCAIISIMLVVRPDPATYMGWRLPGHVPDNDTDEPVCDDGDTECDDDAALRTILSAMPGCSGPFGVSGMSGSRADRASQCSPDVALGTAPDIPPDAAPSVATAASPIAHDAAIEPDASRGHAMPSPPAAPAAQTSPPPRMPTSTWRTPAPIGADGAELPVPAHFSLHDAGAPGMTRTPAPSALSAPSGTSSTSRTSGAPDAPGTPGEPHASHAPHSAPLADQPCAVPPAAPPDTMADTVSTAAAGSAPNAAPVPPARPVLPSEAAPSSYPSAPPAACLADSLRRMGLTRQQVAVTLLLADRHSGPEICDRLNISYNTLKTHVRNIYRQLGVTNQQELRNAVTLFDPARPTA
ncbi:helix-turn-helix transcriptional regulator [Nitratidesulfovibrio sp. SRB-5]|uniref:helix-turn-helix transcriptional regulator n=1 Tax=Nitratidesulfovibrio sp. SRB-5 TaxID=2872636 RepID=UPI001026DF44|nr:helix-turn-helix transcriptional regulator [Nitratidesulfovibrio sp. SRB-5]MBZ2173501.1 helix-turn-helix transcriptional regulator [Nitratidesulfovibrio sp. SRB-5]RXF76641.1 LuxR family transcriptional regulator [Desulfovibrio sp. DS-1]